MTALQHTQVYVRKRGVRVAGLWLLVSVAGLLAFSLMAGIEAAKEQLIERVAFGLIPGILYLVWIVFLNMVSAPIHLAQEDERKRNVLLSKLQEYEQSHSPLELTTSAALSQYKTPEGLGLDSPASAMFQAYGQATFTYDWGRGFKGYVMQNRIFFNADPEGKVSYIAVFGAGSCG